MSTDKIESNEEVDCLVTVNEGAYMTCDMIEEESSEEEIKKEKSPDDYII